MEKQPCSRTCFLCGRQNDIGLKITWYSDFDAAQVRAEIVIPPPFNSYPGFAHGGIVAAILDETAGRAVLLNGDNDQFFVTTRMEVKYRRPTPTGQTVTAVGWVTRQDRNRARVAGEIRLADGTVTASCQATVIKPPQHYFEMWNWEEEKKYWKVYED